MQKRILLLLLLGVVIILLAYFALGNDAKTEMLVAWGYRGPPYGQCFLEIINPSTQTTRHITPDVELCDYGTAIIGDQKRLVHVQSEPAQIAIFAITEDGSVEVEQTLHINNNIRLNRSVPHWDDQGNVYFKGVLEGHEQIFQMNVETGQIAPLFATYEGDTTLISSISPDGRKIIYVRYEGFEQSGLCRLGCYDYYFLYEMENGIELSLAEAISAEIDDDTLTHCHDTWSPTGQFLAFQAGCGSQSTEAHVVIYDVQNRNIVKIIPPPNDYGALWVGWLSETEVIYITSWPPEAINRYSIYDISTGTTGY